MASYTYLIPLNIKFPILSEVPKTDSIFSTKYPKDKQYRQCTLDGLLYKLGDFVLVDKTKRPVLDDEEGTTPKIAQIYRLIDSAEEGPIALVGWFILAKHCPARFLPSLPKDCPPLHPKVDVISDDRFLERHGKISVSDIANFTTVAQVDKTAEPTSAASYANSFYVNRFVLTERHGKLRLLGHKPMSQEDQAGLKAFQQTHEEIRSKYKQSQSKAMDWKRKAKTSAQAHSETTQAPPQRQAKEVKRKAKTSAQGHSEATQASSQRQAKEVKRKAKTSAQSQSETTQVPPQRQAIKVKHKAKMSAHSEATQASPQRKFVEVKREAKTSAQDHSEVTEALPQRKAKTSAQAHSEATQASPRRRVTRSTAPDSSDSDLECEVVPGPTKPVQKRKLFVAESQNIPPASQVTSQQVEGPKLPTSSQPAPLDILDEPGPSERVKLTPRKATWQVQVLTKSPHKSPVRVKFVNKAARPAVNIMESTPDSFDTPVDRPFPKRAAARGVIANAQPVVSDSEDDFLDAQRPKSPQQKSMTDFVFTDNNNAGSKLKFKLTRNVTPVDVETSGARSTRASLTRLQEHGERVEDVAVKHTARDSSLPSSSKVDQSEARKTTASVMGEPQRRTRSSLAKTGTKVNASVSSSEVLPQQLGLLTWQGSSSSISTTMSQFAPYDESTPLIGGVSKCRKPALVVLSDDSSEDGSKTSKQIENNTNTGKLSPSSSDADVSVASVVIESQQSTSQHQGAVKRDGLGPRNASQSQRASQSADASSSNATSQQSTSQRQGAVKRNGLGPRNASQSQRASQSADVMSPQKSTSQREDSASSSQTRRERSELFLDEQKSQPDKTSPLKHARFFIGTDKVLVKPLLRKKAALFVDDSDSDHTPQVVRQPRATAHMTRTPPLQPVVSLRKLTPATVHRLLHQHQATPQASSADSAHSSDEENPLPRSLRDEVSDEAADDARDTPVETEALEPARADNVASSSSQEFLTPETRAVKRGASSQSSDAYFTPPQGSAQPAGSARSSQVIEDSECEELSQKSRASSGGAARRRAEHVSSQVTLISGAQAVSSDSDSSQDKSIIETTPRKSPHPSHSLGFSLRSCKVTQTPESSEKRRKPHVAVSNVVSETSSEDEGDAQAHATVSGPQGSLPQRQDDDCGSLSPVVIPARQSPRSLSPVVIPVRQSPRKCLPGEGDKGKLPQEQLQGETSPKKSTAPPLPQAGPSGSRQSPRKRHVDGSMACNGPVVNKHVAKAMSQLNDDEMTAFIFDSPDYFGERKSPVKLHIPDITDEEIEEISKIAFGPEDSSFTAKSPRKVRPAEDPSFSAKSPSKVRPLEDPSFSVKSPRKVRPAEDPSFSANSPSKVRPLENPSFSAKSPRKVRPAEDPSLVAKSPRKVRPAEDSSFSVKSPNKVRPAEDPSCSVKSPRKVRPAEDSSFTAKSPNKVRPATRISAQELQALASCADLESCDFIPVQFGADKVATSACLPCSSTSSQASTLVGVRQSPRKPREPPHSNAGSSVGPERGREATSEHQVTRQSPRKPQRHPDSITGEAGSSSSPERGREATPEHQVTRQSPRKPQRHPGSITGEASSSSSPERSREATPEHQATRQSPRKPQRHPGSITGEAGSSSSPERSREATPERQVTRQSPKKPLQPPDSIIGEAGSSAGPERGREATPERQVTRQSPKKPLQPPDSIIGEAGSSAGPERGRESTPEHQVTRQSPRKQRQPPGSEGGSSAEPERSREATPERQDTRQSPCKTDLLNKAELRKRQCIDLLRELESEPSSGASSPRSQDSTSRRKQLLASRNVDETNTPEPSPAKQKKRGRPRKSESDCTDTSLSQGSPSKKLKPGDDTQSEVTAPRAKIHFPSFEDADLTLNTQEILRKRKEKKLKEQAQALELYNSLRQRVDDSSIFAVKPGASTSEAEPKVPALRIAKSRLMEGSQGVSQVGSSPKRFKLCKGSKDDSEPRNHKGGRGRPSTPTRATPSKATPVSKQETPKSKRGHPNMEESPNKRARTPSRSQNTPSKSLKTPTKSKASQETPRKSARKVSSCKETPDKGAAKGTPKRGAGSRTSLRTTPHKSSAKKATRATPKKATPRRELASGETEVAEQAMPGRETQMSEIQSFVEAKVHDGGGGCMYISGVPGTGKTASVNQVVRRLRELRAANQIPKFKLLQVSGMELTQPQQVFCRMSEGLLGTKVSSSEAQVRLDKYFRSSSHTKPSTILIIDELDMLCTRRQDVVYTLFDWPTLATAKLTVLAIANTMDLPERLLRGKVTSRLGLTRLTFRPYTFDQLMKIVEVKLFHTGNFDSDAVQLVARKVASVSGDARRALDICRRAAELVDVDKAECVGMKHVMQALKEMLDSTVIESVRNCSALMKLFLNCLVSEMRRTGLEESTLEDVHNAVMSSRVFTDIQVCTMSQVYDACAQLSAMRLIIAEGGDGNIKQRVALNVSSDELHYALEADKRM